MALDWQDYEPLLQLAALAPSSHNCQPWRVVGLARKGFENEIGPLHTDEAGADRILARATHALVVCIDRRRALRALPALEREMHMSVGGFATLLLNLLRLAGVHVAVQWIPSSEAATGRWRTRGAEPVLALHLDAPPGGPRPIEHPLPAWIASRRTVRAPFVAAENGHAGPPPPCVLPHRLGGPVPARWHDVTDAPMLERLAAFYRVHAPEDFRHGAAWRETYAHLSFERADDERLQRAGVGIPVEALFGPLTTWRRRMLQCSLHPQAQRFAGPLGLHARIGRDFEHLVRSSQGVLALVASGQTPDDVRQAHLLAGEAVLDRWLGAAREGLAMHPLSVALQHAPIETALRLLLGVPSPILFIARYGVAPAELPLPRWRRAPAAFLSHESSALSNLSPNPALPCLIVA